LSAVAKPVPTEISILQTFYLLTNGSKWYHNDGWCDPNNDPCTDWYGVSCTSDGTHVQSLSLANNNLVGTIPPELVAIQQIVSLDFSSNHLTGTIPPNFWHLSKMYALSLKDNDLSGVLDLRYMPDLVFAHLDYNHFEGPLDSFCTCKNLKVLGLTNNKINGTIPNCFASFTQLETVQLSGNSLTGSVPAFSGDSLRVLDFSRNSLSGAPSMQDLAKARNLTEVDFFNNKLTGAIEGLSGHPSLTVLDVHNNKMTGSIPSDYATMTNLMALYGQSNGLSGFLPSTFLNAKMAFDFSNNQLYCPIPTPLPPLGKASCSNWTLTLVNPPRCTVGEKCYVVVSGTGFVIGEKAFCQFGKITSAPATVVSDNELRCIVFPKTPGDVDLAISVNGLVVSSNTLPFEFVETNDALTPEPVPNYYKSLRRSYNSSSNADAVKVRIHGMGKCPDYGSIVSIFNDIVGKLGPDVLDLQLGFIMKEASDYPSGFWSLHGQTEVIGNAFIKCVEKTSGPATAVKFASCFAEDISMVPTNAKTCASRFNLDYDSLFQCALSDTGKGLLKQAMDLANNDGASWSPTIFINDELYCLWHSIPCKATTDADFLRAICAAYKGTTPEACK